MASLDALRTIANDLATGFETLLERLEAQKKVEIELRGQLQKTIDKVGEYPVSRIVFI